MQKHIILNIVRDHRSEMIIEARKIEKQIESMQADKERLIKEVKRLTILIEKLDNISN